jgi:hypothetical protein
MKNSLSTRGYPIVLSSSLLFVFWILFALFLPMQKDYIEWVMDPDWVWINLIGFSGSLLGVLAINSYFEHISASMWKSIYYIFSISGIVIMTAILFFEAFILKGIAIQNEEMIVLNEGFYLYQPFRIVSLTGGLLLSLGIIGISWIHISSKTFKRWKVILLVIGTPMFSIILIPGNLRLVGVLLYFISFLLIGLEIEKKLKKN